MLKYINSLQHSKPAYLSLLSMPLRDTERWVCILSRKCPSRSVTGAVENEMSQPALGQLSVIGDGLLASGPCLACILIRECSIRSWTYSSPKRHAAACPGLLQANDLLEHWLMRMQGEGIAKPGQEAPVMFTDVEVPAGWHGSRCFSRFGARYAKSPLRMGYPTLLCIPRRDCRFFTLSKSSDTMEASMLQYSEQLWSS